MDQRGQPTQLLGIWVAILIVIVLNSGCIRRRMTIRTSPPGALVSVDNQVIGTTPAASSFTYYGARDIRVEKEGFQTQTVRHRLDPPWYQYPPLDFITETLWPREIRDERVVDIQLTPEPAEPAADIVARADQLRNQSRQGIIPAPASTGPVQSVPYLTSPQSAPVPLNAAPLNPAPPAVLPNQNLNMPPTATPGPPQPEGLPYGGVPYEYSP